jgi:hypothetical protein
MNRQRVSDEYDGGSSRTLNLWLLRVQTDRRRDLIKEYIKSFYDRFLPSFIVSSCQCSNSLRFWQLQQHCSPAISPPSRRGSRLLVELLYENASLSKQ